MPELNDDSNLLYKEFKVMFIKIITQLRRKMDEHGENFNQGRKYKKYQTEVIELKNTINKLKNTLEA